MKGIECPNKDCLFLHKLADKDDIISREDLNYNKNIFLEQQYYAIKIADIYHPDIRKKVLNIKKIKSVFPSPDLIYNKDVVRENDPVLLKPKIVKKKFEEDKKPRPVENIKNEKKEIRDSLNSTETTDTSMKKLLFKKIHKLFEMKDKSRFEFAGFHKQENIEIPGFINELIVKKVSRHKFTKNIKQYEDILYSDKALLTEYTNNNSWAQFILDNKVIQDDWEFIEDFDYINKLILNKRK